MSKEAINIELIRDYFAGKLDAKAMHDLEKRALEDPFLAEAMDGYESDINNSADNLDELKNRLRERANLSDKKSFSLKPWLIAASVVLLVGISTFFILNNQHKTSQNITQEVVQNATKNLPAKKTDTVNIAINNIRKDSQPLLKKNVEQKKIAIPQTAHTPLNNETSIYHKDSIQLNDVAISRNVVQARKAITASRMNEPLMKNTDTVSIEKQLQNQIPTLDIQPAKRIQVLDSFSKNPIAGAFVRFRNNDSFLTDKYGYFYAPDTSDIANVAALGYENKPVNLNKRIVMLAPAKENLNDVVVVGYGAKNRQQAVGSVADNNNAHITIRGNTSFAKGSNPLIIVNGKIDSLNAVSTQDIKNISVLKNAQAEAMYGSRAANGVVLVTTKETKSDTNTLKRSPLNVSNIAPKTGWNKYEKYIQSQIKKKYFQGVKGAVILHFDISATGKPVNIQITEGLNDERNNQAIEIIQNCPLWNIPPNGIPTSVTYTIDFK